MKSANWPDDAVSRQAAELVLTNSARYLRVLPPRGAFTFGLVSELPPSGAFTFGPVSALPPRGAFTFGPAPVGCIARLGSRQVPLLVQVPPLMLPLQLS